MQFTPMRWRVDFCSKLSRQGRILTGQSSNTLGHWSCDNVVSVDCMSFCLRFVEP